jgi:chaperonin GroEL (HSP60 family)
MKTVLGPKSYDKIFVETDGEVSITNDGATVLTLMVRARNYLTLRKNNLILLQSF